MSYDSNEPKNQGNTKLSEIAIDRAIPFLENSAPQENALVTLENTFKAIAELSRKTNYILHSEGGQISWTGSEIRFDANSIHNSIRLEILATEGSVNSYMFLRLQGSVNNWLSGFNYIPLADGEMVYLELDSSLLVDQGTTFDIENGVNGGSTRVGFRLVKQSSMPKLSISTTGTNTLFSIPLALRRGTDILWIPHGISWEAGTTSRLGAVIVEGKEPYPEKYVSDAAGLTQALSDLSADGQGGVILITRPFTIPSGETIIVPNGIKIIGRGANKNKITLGDGSTILLGTRCILDGLYFSTVNDYQGNMVQTTGSYSRIRDCRIEVTNAFNGASAVGIYAGGFNNRITDCSINGCLSTSRIGILYSGAGNADIDCEDT